MKRQRGMKFFERRNYLTTLCVRARTELAAYPVRLRPPRVGTHAGPRVRPPASPRSPRPLCSLPLLPPAPETALSAFLLEARGPRWRSAVLPTHRATQESSNHFLARSKKHLHLLRLLRSTSSASPSSSSSSIFLSLSLPSLLSCVKCKNLER